MKLTKQLLTPLLMTIVMMAMSPMMIWAQGTNFMVMSDTHVMNKSLFDNGAAFAAYVKTDPKLVENSQDVFDAAIAKIKTAKPKFILIPGDLTKDGEKVSHEYVATKLKELVAEGIKVYVVPGNHDIGNPNAKSYLGDTPAKVTSLTADEFQSSDFYQSCGYANAVMTSGLSYMAYPADGIALIALDSRKPDTETTHYSEGGLTEATLAWAETAAAKARAEGRVVIGMMHHPVIEHFDGHKDIGPTYLTNQSSGYPDLASVQKRLVAAGIGTMFTGHFHLQSIQYEETSAGKLYDVMTGSLSAYPMAMRSGTIAKNGKISLTSITDVASGELIAKAKTRNAITTQGVFSVLAKKMAAKITQAKNGIYGNMLMNVPSSYDEIMALLNEHMKDSYEVLLNSLALGDEDQDNPNEKIANCINAYDSFLNGMFSSLGMFASYAKTMVQDYTAQNTAMVTSVFQNTKGTGPVVADNTNIVATVKPDPVLAFEQETYRFFNYTEGLYVKATSSNGSTGAITYSVEEGDPNELVFNTSTGDIYAESDGTFTIQATIAETEDYKEATATCKVIFKSRPTANSIIVTKTDDGRYFAMTNTYNSNGYIESVQIAKINDKYYVGDNKDAISYCVKTSDDKTIIENMTGQYLQATAAENVSFTDDEYEWTNDGTTLTAATSSHGILRFNPSDPRFTTYTGTSGRNVQIVDINNVSYNMSYDRTSVTEGGYGTICLPYAVAADGQHGLTCYNATISGNYVILEQVDALEAGKPYIFQANDAFITLDMNGTPVTATTNGCLIGVLEATKAPAGSYVLQTREDEDRFYKVAEGTSITIPANRAYLQTSSSTKLFSITFADDEATAVNALNSLIEGSVKIYDINGQQFPALQKGINIVNGVKILVK